jgi:DNA-dependent RNA polymerase auxiliary subunit epsilon
MIFKVFYQETKNRAPRRETTKVLYLDLDVTTAKEGQIEALELLSAKTPYLIELIEAPSASAIAYDRQNGGIEITVF